MNEFIANHWGDIASIIVILSAIWGIMNHSTKKLHADFLELREDNKRVAMRMDGHAQRIDQLYQMFIQLVQEKKLMDKDNK